MPAALGAGEGRVDPAHQALAFARFVRPQVRGLFRLGLFDRSLPRRRLGDLCARGARNGQRERDDRGELQTCRGAHRLLSP
jgi:hypothetical protein